MKWFSSRVKIVYFASCPTYTEMTMDTILNLDFNVRHRGITRVKGCFQWKEVRTILADLSLEMFECPELRKSFNEGKKKVKIGTSSACSK